MILVGILIIFYFRVWIYKRKFIAYYVELAASDRQRSGKTKKMTNEKRNISR
jgi:hypothetical protein